MARITLAYHLRVVPQRWPNALLSVIRIALQAFDVK